MEEKQKPHHGTDLIALTVIRLQFFNAEQLPVSWSLNLIFETLSLAKKESETLLFMVQRTSNQKLVIYQLMTIF